MVESGYLRTWCVSVIRWSPGIVCTIVPTSQSHDGGVVKIEGEFYVWTTTPECSEDRTAVPSMVKTESELCARIHMCVHDQGVNWNVRSLSLWVGPKWPSCLLDFSQSKNCVGPNWPNQFWPSSPYNQQLGRFAQWRNAEINLATLVQSFLTVKNPKGNLATLVQPRERERFHISIYPPKPENSELTFEVESWLFWVQKVKIQFGHFSPLIEFGPSVVKMESELYVCSAHNMCPHSTHTHTL